MMFSSVLLPHPDGPITDTNSPAPTSSDTSLNATVSIRSVRYTFSMPSSRIMGRATAGLTDGRAGTAGAAAPKVPDHIIFPVVGPVQYVDDFGAPRAGVAHQGNDLMAAKKSAAVAAEIGTIGMKYGTVSPTWISCNGGSAKRIDAPTWNP